LLAPAAQRHFQKLVLVTARKLPVYKALDQTLDGRAHSIALLGKHTIVRKIVCEVDSVNLSSAISVRAANFYFSVDPTRAQNCRVDKISAIGSEDNDHIIERIDPVHLRAKHRNQRRKNVRMTRCPPRAENRFGLVDK